jgi:hypothetical protein
MGLSESDKIGQWTMFIPSLASFIGGIFILVTFFSFQKLRTLTISLLILQTFSEMIFNLSHNILFFNPPSDGTIMCNLQGWLISFSRMSSIFYSGIMSAHMYMVIRRRGNYELTVPLLKNIIIVVHVVAAILASIPFATNQYSDIGPKCWIAENENGRNRRNGNIMRFTTHYNIIWFVCICCTYVYRDIHKYIKSINRGLREHSISGTSMSCDKILHTLNLLKFYPGNC